MQSKSELPHESAQKLKLLQLALCLLGSLLAVELSVGIFSHSLALLADAEHVFADMGAISIALLVIWLSGQSFKEYPWIKYYRLEAIAAFINGTGLLAVAGWTIWEAIIRLNSASDQILGLPMLVAAGFGLIINSINALFLHSCSHNDLNVRAAFLHLLADVIGSIGAIFAAIAVTWLGWNWADGAVSILVAVIVTFFAITLIGQSLKNWNNNLHNSLQTCNCPLSHDQTLFPSLQESINRNTL
jgi:cobalt-zinc-cadmium efflux system protein